MTKQDRKTSAFIRFYGLNNPRISASTRFGFTLIELVIVIMLTTLIASFAIVYSRQSGTQIALYVEAQKMAELVFRAKSMALTAYRDPALGNVCGFGFEIDYAQQEYLLFSYDVPPLPDRCGTVAAIDPDLITELPGQRYAPGRDLEVRQTPPEALQYVLFIPPEPTTIVSRNGTGGSPSPNGVGTIDLQTANGSVMTIRISSGGQISF